MNKQEFESVVRGGRRDFSFETFNGDFQGACFFGLGLTGAFFSGADLRGADFGRASLFNISWTGTKINKTTTFGLVVPYVKDINTKILAQIEKEPDTFDMCVWHYNSHRETARCWAGWAVTLAGAGGRVLEGCVGSSTAGMLILAASMRAIGVNEFVCPDFFSVEREALKAIREFSEIEKKAMGGLYGAT